MAQTDILDRIIEVSPDRRQWAINYDNETHIGFVKKGTPWKQVLDLVAQRLDDPNTSPADKKKLITILSHVNLNCGTEMLAMIDSMSIKKYLETEKHIDSSLPLDSFGSCIVDSNEHVTVPTEAVFQLARNKEACLMCRKGSIILSSEKSHFDSKEHIELLKSAESRGARWLLTTKL